MANKIMIQYKISHADVVSRAKTAEDKANLGGQSTVSIKPTKEGTQVVNQTWVHDMASAIKLFFQCNVYSTARPASIDW